jgi:hypothetical protein
MNLVMLATLEVNCAHRQELACEEQAQRFGKA